MLYFAQLAAPSPGSRIDVVEPRRRAPRPAATSSARVTRVGVGRRHDDRPLRRCGSGNSYACGNASAIARTSSANSRMRVDVERHHAAGLQLRLHLLVKLPRPQRQRHAASRRCRPTA